MAGVSRSEPPVSAQRTIRSHIQVEVANCQRRMKVDRRALSRAVQIVLAGEILRGAQISVAVVDGRTMRKLNRQYLHHDYDTDVLSFRLDDAPRPAKTKGANPLEGEIVVSADRALVVAENYGWSPREELLLYVVHGALHLAGHDDKNRDQRAAMRTLETKYLAKMGLTRVND
ncbi:MAG: rRNA maturation RNase YbeY [Planctomycetia bacterium]|nr:rRNA maturation RNase YbeY [Planctomycetia bacterium]